MAYLGNDLQVAFPSYRNIDDISGSFNGVTTSFPLTVDGVAPIPAPVNSQQCLISVNGVVQRPDDSGSEGFLLSGGNIVFASAPAGGVDFFGVILAGADYVNVGANFPSGTALAPSITFESDLDTGIYNPAGNQIGFSTAGTQRLVINSSGQISSGLGTAAAPAFSFISDPNTGVYSPGADQLALSTNGVQRINIEADGDINIDSGGVFYDATNNRLAIGTTSPASLLSVDKGNVTNRGQWSDCGIALHNPTNIGAYSQIGFGYTPSQTYASAYIGYLSTNQGASGYGDIVFGTRSVNTDSQPSERARIDSSGRLLVGTSSTSLTSKLVVKARTDDATGNGSITLQRGSLPSAAEQTIGAVQFTDNNDNYGAVISAVSEGSWVSGSNHRSRLVFSTTADGASSPTPRMTIDRDGNITANSFDTAFTGAFYRFSASSGESPQVRIGGNADLSAGTTDVSIGLYRWDHAQYTQTRTNMYAYIEGRAIVEWAFQNYGTYLRFYTRTWNNGNTGPNEKMRLTHDGKLLIGYTGDNGNYKLQVNSQIFATSSTIATSDGRYKEDIATLDGCVDLVKALRPVSFTWKPQEDIVYTDSEGNEEIARKAHNFPEGVQVGFIAQEVQDVLVDKPWLGSIIKENSRPAVTDGEGNELAPEEEFLGIAEGNLVAVLTSALKDAIGRIEILEAEVAALKAQ